MALGVSCVLGLGSAPERVQVTLELKARQKAAFVGRLQSATPTRRIRMQKGEGRDRRGPPRRVDHLYFGFFRFLFRLIPTCFIGVLY